MKESDAPVVALFLPNLAGGGAERITLNLARGIVERSIGVDLVLASSDGAYRDEVPSGVSVVDLQTHRTLAAMPRLVAYLRRRRPTSIVSAMNHANIVTLWAASLARYRGRVVVAEHNELPHPSASMWQRAFNATMRWTYPRASRVVAVSSGVKQSLIDHAGVREASIDVIFNPVIGEALAPRRREVPAVFSDRDGPVFVAVGRLTEQKNYPNLVRAFARVRARTHARLLILGEGPDRAGIEAMIGELGLSEDVSLLGFVPDVYDYIAAADALVLSSDWEGLPTVLIEALALGTKIVSTDCRSGPREILADGRFGALVPVGDAERLGDAMLAALDAPDPTVPDAWLEQFREAPAVTRYMQACGL